MDVTDELAIAERIARDAHDGQLDPVTGEPYIRHVERVVDLVEGQDAKIVAWLHDVVEDCQHMWPSGLRREGIAEHHIASVVLLSRNLGPIGYDAYIERIGNSRDAVAIAVKIADLTDHLRPNCPASLRPRYEKALKQLRQDAAYEKALQILERTI